MVGPESEAAASIVLPGQGEEMAVIRTVPDGSGGARRVGGLAGCMTMGAQEKEGQLAAAGFVRQPADTPRK